MAHWFDESFDRALSFWTDPKVREARALARPPLDEAAVLDSIGAAFGRKPSNEPSSNAWRTGQPGLLTEAEVLAMVRRPFGHNVQEGDRLERQVAAERRVLREAAEKGWDWLEANTHGRDAALVESVRTRLGESGAALQESTGAAMLDAGLRVQVRESTAVAPTPIGAKRLRVTLISPGHGASGYYPAETLEAAVRDRVFHKGLQLFLDHPTAREAQDRPERSVRDLAGVLATDARWTGSAVVAEADVLPAHAELIGSLAGVIGMSIRAQGDVEMASVAGQRVKKITRLLAAESCDFVTRAGRGGFYEVIESDRRSWGS